ncbi:hypothetical protein BS47DRAFT_1375869 [Hydnum rufescens UP504]|uniref:C3H1-type domain-containing protein n=1 Tax=Hydnum rufescens UP504 TaxID=1448309 RepID=A0A9P6B362_9AGAM|nr:hypothetical protein BS47DRAFT_1375869 [Hydnum rufescens UP504]
MAICQFYLRGQCRFGERCINEHVDNSASKFGSSWGSRSSSSANNAISPSKAAPQSFTVESIKRDVTEGMEKPTWPFSSYGPAKYEPNLVPGLDLSPDELRVKYWEAMGQGNPNYYTNYEVSQMNTVVSTYQSVLNDAQGAFKKAFEQSPSTGSNTAQPSAFGGTAFGSGSGFASTPSAFGSTSAFGSSAQITPAFGQTSFGSPVARPSAFGTPAAISSFGTSPSVGSSFGTFANKPSAFSTSFSSPSQPSAFGTSASTPSFGQSSFGTPQPITSAFGTSSSFGRPSAFANPTANTNSTSSGGGFGAFSNPSAPSAFGQASSFGQPATPSSTTPAFGQPPPRTSAFGQSSTTTNQSAFGAPSTPSGSAFSAFASQPSAFGNPSSSSPVRHDFRLRGSDGNYAELLPQDAKDAFAAEEFEWGKIPEWIPPLEFR